MDPSHSVFGYWTAYRRAVCSRIVAAVVGGYLFATVVAAFCSRLMHADQTAAVTTALLSSFLIYAFAIMWAFAARTAWRAWLGLLVPSAVMCLLLSLTNPGLS